MTFLALIPRSDPHCRRAAKKSVRAARSRIISPHRLVVDANKGVVGVGQRRTLLVCFGIPHAKESKAMASDQVPLIDERAELGNWGKFRSEGFAHEVRGLVLSDTTNQCCGVSLGGLGTGCIDILPSGVFGFSTIFPVGRRHPAKSYQPVYRNPQLLLPFLGVAIDGSTTVLASPERLRGGRQNGCIEPGMGRELTDNPDWVAAWTPTVPSVDGVRSAEGIRYWGHFPIADLDYSTGDPVSVSLRAWSPFMPGDIDASNVPGAVFDVMLTNSSRAEKAISLVLTFPGMVDMSPLPTHATRVEVSNSDLQGITVSAAGADYTIAVIGNGNVRSGYGIFGDAWGDVANRLPKDSSWSPGSWHGTEQLDTSASTAADFTLPAGGSATVRFVLAWNAPAWQGAGFEDIEGFERWDPGPLLTPGRQKGEYTQYQSRYSTRFENSVAAARYLSENHDRLLERLIAWQSVLYNAPELPDWLPDILINSLNLLTKDSFWAAPSVELGEWSFPLGAFGMSESPRGCDVTGCIVSNWYGDFPLLYFFPQLELAILRNYQAYLRPDGAIPFLYPSRDLTRPTYEWLIPLNGPCFVDLVGRLWRRTGNLEELRELYPAVKATTQFTIGLRGGEDGVVGVHREGTGQEWWEHTAVKGLVTHAAGVRLATVAIAAELADIVGDHEFAAWARGQLERGSAIVEEKLWNGNSYLFYFDPESGESNKDILSSQLDGDWISGLHGHSPVFQADRARKSLQTIIEKCSVPCGLIGFVPGDLSDDISSEHSVPAEAAAYGSFTAEMQIVAMTLMYAGMVDEGLDLAFRALDNLFRVQGHAWDLPNMIVADSCERYFGTDYFQNLSLWALPAAMQQTPLSGLWEGDGLVARLLAAARGTTE